MHDKEVLLFCKMLQCGISFSCQRYKILCPYMTQTNKSESSMLIIVQRDAITYSLLIAANRSTCFGWWYHPLSGAHITAFTVSGTGRSVWAATSYYRGWIESLYPPFTASGTGRNVWAATSGYRGWIETLYPPTIAGDSSSDIKTSTRCCKYSYIRSWWWVVSPSETFRAVCSNK